MAARTAFGQRSTARPVAPPPASGRNKAAQAAMIEDAAPRRAGEEMALPFLTAGLIALLGAIFWLEVAWADDFAAYLSPSRHALLVLGGIDAKLVFGSNEWWRLFTAPLLHGGLSHVIGNCVVLGLVGFYLEPLIGWAWFAGIFAIAALGGDFGSLGQNDPNLLSVGASGAITGLLAAGLVCAGRMRNEERRARMQKWTGRILIYATLPAYLSASAASGHTDYGAHVGGALFGGVAGFLVTLTWDRQRGRPSFTPLAMGIAGGFAALALIGFLLAAMERGAHASEGPGLIPYQEMPKDDKDAIARSADLLARYPGDPRAHYFRALHFVEHNDLSEAAGELRQALAVEAAHPDSFTPVVDQTVRMTLALVIKGEGDLEAARAMAKEACAQSAASSRLLRILKRQRICE